MMLIIVGPQGSGKGTQAELISKEFNIPHVSTGDILREEAKKTTEQGKMIKEFMQKGILVPDEINDRIVKDVVEKHEHNLLLDGYPRSIHQAEVLMKITKINAIIVLKIDDEESIKRISKRRICTATKKILIADQITNRDIQECKMAGGEIIIREDDKPDAVRKRLQIYHDQTKPVIELFKKQEIEILEINGERPIENVFQDIKGKIENLT